MERLLLLGFLGLVHLSIIVTQTTPVPILKQINRQNEDGSYSYGYENADGTYKIETKSANGEIRGKYGYIDEYGKIREIEYGASKRGFEPAGPGITVAPPTIHQQNENNVEPDYDDGQYREDPSIYYKTDKPLSRLPTKAAPLPFTNNFKYESNINPQPQPILNYNDYRPSPYSFYSTYHDHQASNPFARSYTINNYSG